MIPYTTGGMTAAMRATEDDLKPEQITAEADELTTSGEVIEFEKAAETAQVVNTEGECQCPDCDGCNGHPKHHILAGDFTDEDCDICDPCYQDYLTQRDAPGAEFEKAAETAENELCCMCGGFHPLVGIPCTKRAK